MEFASLSTARYEYDPVYGEMIVIDNDKWQDVYYNNGNVNLDIDQDIEIFDNINEEEYSAFLIQDWWLNLKKRK